MKLETLKKYFAHAKQTKLYVMTGEYPGEFAVAGIASNPRADGEDLLLDIDQYIVYSFARDELLPQEQEYRGLRLGPQTQVTRRIETHRRHALKVRSLATPHLEQYFSKALDFTR